MRIKRWKQYDNHKVIDWLKKKQSVHGDTKSLKKALSKIIRADIGDKFNGVTVNEHLKRFAELMLTQVPIKKFTDGLSKINNRIKKISTTIEGLETTSSDDSKTQILSLKKKL